MKHPLPIVAGVAILAALAVVFWPDGDTAPPPVVAAEDETVGVSDVDRRESLRAAEASGPTREIARTEEEALEASLDPSVREALCGFTGRVLDPELSPVPDSLVRLHRFSQDVILQQEFDPFGRGPKFEVEFVVADVRTDDEGRFLIPGAHPGAVFALEADVDGDRPTFQMIQRGPGPGEIVDIGDVILEDLVILTGRLVDVMGDPVADAEVWALDVPGTPAVAAAPVGRIDLQGGLIIEEGPVDIVKFPSWVETRLEQLPLPRTHSGSDGRFRLTRVRPGPNLFVARKTGLAPFVNPGLQAKGPEKDLGDIRMKDGEIVVGRVEDQDGEPVVGAEVMLANKSTAIPVHFASFGPKSDAEGRFELAGFSGAPIFGAARRRPSDPWTVVGPAPALDDLIIQLPSERQLIVSVTDANGQPLSDVDFLLVNGDPDDGAYQMTLFGLQDPIRLDDRMEVDEQGRYVLSNLPSGRYALLVGKDGYSSQQFEFDLSENREANVALIPQPAISVTVLRPDGEAARGTKVYAMARGKNEYPEDLPVLCGTVDAEGILFVDEVSGERVRLTADHPAYGLVHAEVEFAPDAAVTLQFEAPGRLEGILTKMGEIPDPAEYTIVVNRERNGGPRGAVEFMPKLVAADLEGNFGVNGLQPGKYEVIALNSISAFTSPGSLMENFFVSMMFNEPKKREVDIVSEQTTFVELDAEAENPIDGPAVNVSGTAFLDGVPAIGYSVMVFGDRRKLVDVEPTGRFDLGQMPVGDLYLQVVKKSGDGKDPGQMFNGSNQVFSSSYELTEGENLVLRIDVRTAPIAGIVLNSDGTPAAEVRVSMSGQIDESNEGKSINWFSYSEETDSRGRFSIPNARVGTYSFEVEEGPQQGSLENVVVEPGVGATNIRMQLQATATVSGTVDLGAYRDNPPTRVRVRLTELLEDGGRNWNWRLRDRISEDGSFRIEGVRSGTYAWSIEAQGYDSDDEQLGTIRVDGIDREGIVLRPVLTPEQTEPLAPPPVPATIRGGGGR